MPPISLGPLPQPEQAAPSHANNYMLPLDSPRSPRPNAAVDAVALIVARVIQQNEAYLRSIHPRTPEYRYPRLVAQFTYADGQLAEQLAAAGFPTSDGPLPPELPDAALPVVQKRIHKFVHNFAYRTRMRNETIVGALVYLDRIVEKAGFVVFRANWLLLMTQCLITVQKMYDDFHYSLKDYVKVVNVPLSILSRIEHTFLKLIRYDLVVRQGDYMRYRNYITAKYVGCELRPAYPSSPMSTLPGLASIRDYCESIRPSQGPGQPQDQSQPGPQSQRKPESVQFVSNTSADSMCQSPSGRRLAERSVDTREAEGSQGGTDGLAPNSDVEEDDVTASQANLQGTLMHMDDGTRAESARTEGPRGEGGDRHAGGAGDPARRGAGKWEGAAPGSAPLHRGRNRPEPGSRNSSATPAGREAGSAHSGHGEHGEHGDHHGQPKSGLAHARRAEHVSASVGDLLKQVKLPTNKF